MLGAGLVENARVSLLSYMRNNRYVVGMGKNNRRVFNDNLCFFTFLAMGLDCICDLDSCVLRVAGHKDAVGTGFWH